MFDTLAHIAEIAGIIYLIFLGHGIPSAITTALTAAGKTVTTDAQAVITDVSNVVDPKAAVPVAAAAPAPAAA